MVKFKATPSYSFIVVSNFSNLEFYMAKAHNQPFSVQAKPGLVVRHLAIFVIEFPPRPVLICWPRSWLCTLNYRNQKIASIAWQAFIEIYLIIILIPHQASVYSNIHLHGQVWSARTNGHADHEFSYYYCLLQWLLVEQLNAHHSCQVSSHNDICMLMPGSQ